MYKAVQYITGVQIQYKCTVVTVRSSKGGHKWEGGSPCLCFLMWHASSESLTCKFSCWSKIVTSLQSTRWLLSYYSLLFGFCTQLLLWLLWLTRLTVDLDPRCFKRGAASSARLVVLCWVSKMKWPNRVVMFSLYLKPMNNMSSRRKPAAPPITNFFAKRSRLGK